MSKAADVKATVSEAMSIVVDEPLARTGFMRRRGALVYRRALNDVEHAINFVVHCFPQYRRDMDVHIQPWVQVRLPVISDISIRLLKGDKALLANAPDLVLNQPLDLVAPRDAHQRWFAKSPEDYLETCNSILDFLQDWGIPFLSAISTPADLVQMYRTNDARVLAQKHWYVYVVAALVSLDEGERALEVAQREFASPLLRRRYAPLFESLTDGRIGEQASP
jgi:hypothetical protein